MGVFDYDNSLPALPIPDVKDTCCIIKKMLKPLLSEEAWVEECRSIDEFFEKDGAGERLQRLLLEWKEAKGGNDSWLRPIWDDNYLSYRDALPVNMNYCFQLTNKRWGENGLSYIIAGLCEQINKIRDESLPAEQSRAGHLSMDTLQHVVYTRIPEPVKDVWYHPSFAARMTVAVACRGHWFIMSVMNEDGMIASPSAIKKALEHIRTIATGMEPGYGVGALTSAERDTAFHLRSSLQDNLLNRMSLESIEKALFVVCLDEMQGSKDDFGCHILGGDAANRWFDKSLQIISSGGCNIGVNIEHSGCDAGIWVYLLAQMDSFLSGQSFSIDENEAAAGVRVLEWNVKTPLVKELENLRELFKSVMDRISLCQRKIPFISRDIIKAKKCSPDAFVQILYQAAYYKLTGSFRSVYEAVSTRNFYEGRTECVRPLTEESTAFVKAFVESSEGAPKLNERFRAAEQTHVDGIRIRQKALGPERHMAGLSSVYKMYSGTPKGAGLMEPGILNLEGYRALRRDVLSTSSITAPFIDYFGFGPVVQDGIGIGYGFKGDALHLMVTTYPESGFKAHEFIDAVEEMANKLLILLSA